MSLKVIFRDQIFTHHQIVMWPSNTQPYFVCHLPLVLVTKGATWRATGLVDMQSLESGQEINRTKGTRVNYRGRGLTYNEIFSSSIFILFNIG